MSLVNERPQFNVDLNALLNLDNISGLSRFFSRTQKNKTEISRRFCFMFSSLLVFINPHQNLLLSSIAELRSCLRPWNRLNVLQCQSVHDDGFRSCAIHSFVGSFGCEISKDFMVSINFNWFYVCGEKWMKFYGHEHSFRIQL